MGGKANISIVVRRKVEMGSRVSFPGLIKTCRCSSLFLNPTLCIYVGV
jgi:hypothetical protein